MNIKINLVPAKDYMDICNCPIARGLRRKGILATVGPDMWYGKFLGLIPVWGTVPEETDLAAYQKMNVDTTRKYTVGLFDN